MTIKRNLAQSGDDMYINKWWTGLVTQRSPLFVPVSSLGVQVIARHDSLLDGRNIEVSPNMTLTRRPGFPAYCSEPLGAEKPLQFFSYKNTSGTIKPMLDTASRVAWFDTTSISTVFAKSTAAQTSFQKVADVAYMYNGTDAKRWNGTKNWARYTEDFSNALWVAIAASATTNTISFNAKGTNSFAGVTQDCGIAANGQQATLSVELKCASGTQQVELVIQDTPFTAGFATQTVTVTTAWQRFSISGAVTSANPIQIHVRSPYALALGAFTVSARNAQLELSGAATSYESNTNNIPVTNIGINFPTIAPNLSFAAGVLSPVSGYKYVYCYRRSTTGEVSTASPASASTLAQTNKNVTITGPSSTDPTVDKVDIFRTRDGGSLYYLLASVNNGGTWTYTDSSADISLNDDIVAPTAHLNDPPPAGANLACFHMGRMWVAACNKLYFGGGPQVTYGVPESCFPPANVFVLPGKITAMVSTSSGLAVWTEDDFYVATGSDLANFNVRRYQANFGVASQNCVVQDGDLLLVLTTNKQLFRFSDTLDEIGYSIRNLLSDINPASAYLTLHRSGTDEGLFISDGATKVYRYSLAQNCWCTASEIVGGVGCVSSIEVATADYRLLAGRADNAGKILARSLTEFNDEGTAYGADATIGTLMLAPPGQVATLKSILLECMPVGSYPTLSVLLNEISGTFTTLPDPVQDPPMLDPSATVWARRHDLLKAPLPRQLRYMLVKVEFPAEDAKSELLGMAAQG